MSILVTDKNEEVLRNTIITYIIATIIVAIFGIIYEHFSHGVYSYYMIYAFIYPLLVGVAPYLIMSLTSIRFIPGKISFNMYNSGVATITVGSLVEGVLEIYGTENIQTIMYWMIGILFVSIGMILYLIGMFFYKKN